MASYIALLHKDEGTHWGISFPDVPGCISSGGTMDEALAMGAEALAGHLALMAEDGEELPVPRALEAIRADGENADDLEGAVVALVSPAIGLAPRVTVDVALDLGVLNAVDRAAQAAGVSRSTFLEQAARERLGKVA